MSTRLKYVYEFTKREIWAKYVTTNMRKIKAQRKLDEGVEVWLLTDRGVIGKWCVETNRGYIEEYRTDGRIDREYKKVETPET